MTLPDFRTARVYALGPSPRPGADAWVCDAPPDAALRMAGQRLVLRIRAASAPDFARQAEAAMAAPDANAIDALMLCGVKDIADACVIAERWPQPIVVAIDGAQALDQARALANVPGVACLLFDAHALQRRLAIEHEDGLLAFRSRVVLASCLAGLPPPVDDSALPPMRARALGFGAAICRSAEALAAARAAFAETVSPPA